MKGNTLGEGRIHLFEKDGGQTPNKTKMGGVPSKTCDRGRGARGPPYIFLGITIESEYFKRSKKQITLKTGAISFELLPFELLFI